MGASQAHEFAALVGEGLPLRSALVYHLESNHYPPISRDWIPAAEEAIELASAGIWDADIARPDGYATAELPTNSVYDIIENLHLDPFITNPDYED
jgi:hypothetical protein